MRVYCIISEISFKILSSSSSYSAAKLVSSLPVTNTCSEEFFWGLEKLLWTKDKNHCVHRSGSLIWFMGCSREIVFQRLDPAFRSNWAFWKVCPLWGVLSNCEGHFWVFLSLAVVRPVLGSIVSILGVPDLAVCGLGGVMSNPWAFLGEIWALYFVSKLPFISNLIYFGSNKIVVVWNLHFLVRNYFC